MPREEHGGENGVGLIVFDDSGDLSRVYARETKQRVVITGGAGLLGSHLCERLVGEGHHVICVDNFHTGRPENVRALVPARTALARGGDRFAPPMAANSEDVSAFSSNAGGSAESAFRKRASGNVSYGIAP